MSSPSGAPKQRGSRGEGVLMEKFHQDVGLFFNRFTTDGCALLGQDSILVNVCVFFTLAAYAVTLPNS